MASGSFPDNDYSDIITKSNFWSVESSMLDNMKLLLQSIHEQLTSMNLVTEFLPFLFKPSLLVSGKYQPQGSELPFQPCSNPSTEQQQPAGTVL